jgi:hypothetical protein
MCSSARLLLGLTCMAERCLCRRDREPPLVEAIIMDGHHELLAPLGLSLRAYCFEYCRYDLDPGRRDPCETPGRLANMAIANGHLDTLKHLYVYYNHTSYYFNTDSIRLAIEFAQWQILEWLLSVVHPYPTWSLDYDWRSVFQGHTSFVVFNKPHLVDRYEDYHRAMKVDQCHVLWPLFREAVKEGHVPLVWRIIWNTVNPRDPHPDAVDYFT